MTHARNLRRDFEALLDPDEPQCGCKVLTEYLGLDTKHRTAMSETLRLIVLDPLNWYLVEVWKKHGTCNMPAANAFHLAADDIRYRLAYQESICIEEIEALEQRWVLFQAEVGHHTACMYQKAAPAIRTGRKIKESASRGHAAVYGTQEDKAARWGKYRKDCVDVARDNPRMGLTAIRQTVADRNGVTIKTIARHTPDLAHILKDA